LYQLDQGRRAFFPPIDRESMPVLIAARALPLGQAA